jgi:hypothetical protein
MKVDDNDDLDDAFQQLKIASKEIICQYVAPELIQHRGTILQFINMNSTGSTTMIGATRISVSDIRKVPAYLSRNKALIRQHAVATLTEHLLDTQCPAGALECLTYEDYSISFAVATVTEEARLLNPMGRNEGPLFYCAFDNLVQPVALHAGASSIAVHVINVYIMLLEPAKRRSAVVQKARDEEAACQNYIREKPKWVRQVEINQRSAALEAQKRAASNTALPAVIFPPLPTGPMPEWNRTGRNPLPLE